MNVWDIIGGNIDTNMFHNIDEDISNYAKLLKE